MKPKQAGEQEMYGDRNPVCEHVTLGGKVWM